jgi:hypothetical protein
MPSPIVGGSSLMGLSRRVAFGPTMGVLYMDLDPGESGDADGGIMPVCGG